MDHATLPVRNLEASLEGALKWLFDEDGAQSIESVGPVIK
jgi:hypothetical protein